jgi:hypothetical protein
MTVFAVAQSKVIVHRCGIPQRAAVFLLSIILSLGGFAAGVYLTYRFVPPLRDTREGTIASWIVRVLIGAALSWAALELYFCIYAFANFSRTNEFRGPIVNGARTAILTQTVHSIFLLSGLLLAAAAIVYFLAPAGDEEMPA